MKKSFLVYAAFSLVFALVTRAEETTAFSDADLDFAGAAGHE